MKNYALYLLLIISILTLLGLSLSACLPNLPSPAATEKVPPLAYSKIEEISPTVSSSLEMSVLLKRVAPTIVRIVTNDGMGSGIIVNIDLDQVIILTNSHVVGESQSVEVILSDNRKFNASVLSRDETKDLAALIIEVSGLSVIALGNSEQISQGDEVISIGYPLDLEGSATISRGIVSAFRTDKESGITYIQTDASINPGSSGGALVNLAGELVGIPIKTIRVSDGLPIEGMNFAIAIDSIKPVIQRLFNGESILKPVQWLTFTNSNYRYSIQYPNTWCIIELGDNKPEHSGTLYLSSMAKTHAQVTIVVDKFDDPTTDVSLEIDSFIALRNDWVHQGKMSRFDVISRKDLYWQDIYPGCIWECLAGDVRYYDLWLKIDRYLYKIFGFDNQLEYSSDSNNIKYIVNSFRIIN